MEKILLSIQSSSICGHAYTKGWRPLLQGREESSYYKEYKGRLYMGRLEEGECAQCNKALKKSLDQQVYRKHAQLEKVGQ